jgi:hypothetical protein
MVGEHAGVVVIADSQLLPPAIGSGRLVEQKPAQTSLCLASVGDGTVLVLDVSIEEGGV